MRKLTSLGSSNVTKGSWLDPYYSLLQKKVISLEKEKKKKEKENRIKRIRISSF